MGNRRRNRPGCTTDSAAPRRRDGCRRCSRETRRPGTDAVDRYGRKNDDADAVSVGIAARSARTLTSVTVEGTVTALRAIVEHRDDLVKTRTHTVNRLHVVLTNLIPAGAQRDLTADQAAELLRGTRPRDVAGKTLRGLAADLVTEIRHLDRRIAKATADIETAVTASGTTLTELRGIGALTAGTILGRVGSISRFRSAAAFATYTGTAPIDVSSGDVVRHRLSRAGDRQLNRCLHVMALTQIRLDTPGRTYYLRKRTDGKGHEPAVALLSAGREDPAFFEHKFLAEQMGVALVAPSDLSVRDRKAFRHIGSGSQPVDVIYAPMDEDMLLSSTAHDGMPLRPGLLEALTAGNLTIVNALGNGVADDKAVYAFVPAIIEYYLGERPSLAQLPTWICAERAQRDYVLDHLGELVVKPIDGMGGSGVLIGPEATDAAFEVRRRELLIRPERFIAQELVALSTHPTFDGDGMYPHHVDLRAFVHLRPASGASVTAHLMPAALTRAASRGSRIVNSLSGATSKDTWILTSRQAVRTKLSHTPVV